MRAREAHTNGLISQMNIRDEVYHILRRGIINQEYPPGFRFNLAELESRLGVSRTPIKEALQRLESEGLVQIRARRGTFVISIDPQEVEDTWEIRRVLETYAARHILAKATEQDLAQLKAIVNELERLYPETDVLEVVERVITLDHNFHTLFVSLAGNKRLSEIYDTVGHFVQLVRVQQIFMHSDLELARFEHHEILSALDQRDTEALVRAVDEHLTLSKDRFWKRFMEDHAF